MEGVLVCGGAADENQSCLQHGGEVVRAVWRLNPRGQSSELCLGQSWGEVEETIPKQKLMYSNGSLTEVLTNDFLIQLKL